MSRQSLPSLIESLSDRNGLVRDRARHTLVLIGSPAVPALLELLKNPTKRPRWEAAKALGAIAEPSSIPALVELLSDRESEIRWLGAVGLTRVGPRAIPQVLRALIEKPESIDIRRGARHYFHDIGRENPVVQEIVAPVLDVLGDVDPVSALPPKAQQALNEIRAFQEGA
ncbi:MAG: HEAT repeat domain-containing protein [bacterium]